MFSKLLVFGVLAILAIQSFSQAKTIPQKDELEEEVLETVELIKRLVLAAEDTADKVTSDLFNEIKLDASGIYNGAIKKIDQTAEATIAEFHKLQETADDLNIDVTECLQGKEEDISRRATIVSDNVMDCTDAAILEVYSLIQQLGEEYTRLKAAAEQLERDFENCENQLCFEQLLFRANELLLTLPTELKEILKEALTSIGYVQDNLPMCDYAITEYFDEVTRSILKDVSDCVTDKIEGSSR